MYVPREVTGCLVTEALPQAHCTSVFTAWQEPALWVTFFISSCLPKATLACMFFIIWLYGTACTASACDACTAFYGQYDRLPGLYNVSACACVVQLAMYFDKDAYMLGRHFHLHDVLLLVRLWLL